MKKQEKQFCILGRGKNIIFCLENQESHVVIFLKTSSVFLRFHVYTLRRQILFFGA